MTITTIALGGRNEGNVALLSREIYKHPDTRVIKLHGARTDLTYDRYLQTLTYSTWISFGTSIFSPMTWNRVDDDMIHAVARDPDSRIDENGRDSMMNINLQKHGATKEPF